MVDFPTPGGWITAMPLDPVAVLIAFPVLH